jgi:hypothetical protein
MEHDEVGCKHTGCECKTTQQMIMGEPPSLISLIYFPERSSEYWQNKAIKIGHINIPIENPRIVIVPEKLFSKIYQNADPDRIFGIAVESLGKMDYFKVWTVDQKNRSLEMTTYGTSLAKDGWREQIRLNIESDNNVDSIVRIHVTPSLEPGMFSFMAWHRKGVIERIADSIAEMIFDTIEKGLRQVFSY